MHANRVGKILARDLGWMAELRRTELVGRWEMSIKGF